MLNLMGEEDKENFRTGMNGAVVGSLGVKGVNFYVCHLCFC